MDITGNHLIEDAYERIKNKQTEEEKLLLEEKENKRKETYQKFKELKRLLNENISSQKLIKEAMYKLKFSVKEVTKPNYPYYIFCFCTVVCAFFAIWYYNKVILNIKFFYLYLVIVFILINCTALYITTYIRQRRIYMNYIDKCNTNYINNDDIINLISSMLDNYLEILNIIPHRFFKYFTREYQSSSVEGYMFFLCKNCKLISKKWKNKSLRIYKKVYSKNTEFLLDIEEMENSYFQSKLTGQLCDTIEECVGKFLSYK